MSSRLRGRGWWRCWGAVHQAGTHCITMPRSPDSRRKSLMVSYPTEVVDGLISEGGKADAVPKMNGDLGDLGDLVEQEMLSAAQGLRQLPHASNTPGRAPVVRCTMAA